MTNICQLETLPYLGACLNETLRLMPPVPTLQRETVVDISLSGQTIPAGTVIIMSPWSMQRCEKFWGPNAAVFFPDRWLPNEKPSKGNDAKQSILTFGQGPRNCIGITFARKELETMLVGLVGCFDIKPADHQSPLPVRHDILVRPMEDLMVRMEALEGW